MIKIFFKWLFTFDEFMKPFIFVILSFFIMNIPELIHLKDINEVLLMLGMYLGIILLLHLYQPIARSLGMEKAYFNLKEALIKDYQKIKEKFIKKK